MVKQFLKRTFVYDLWKSYRGYSQSQIQPVVNELDLWIENGRPAPPPHFVKIDTIKAYAQSHHIKTFIETGTFYGHTTLACVDTFDSLITIELDEKLYQNAVLKFKEQKHVKVYRGDSGEVLGEIIPQLTTNCLFWLDGHYSMGPTAKGALNTPILKELEHIFNHSIYHTILIDDARCFTGEDDYPTIAELHRFVSNFSPDTVFTVLDDVIRIHHSSLPDIDNFPVKLRPQTHLGSHIEIMEGTGVDQFCSIGNYTYIGQRCAITKATIGRYCSIGDNVTIGPGEHDLNLLSTSALFYNNPWETLTEKDCEIGNDVWIGVDSIIKRGVKVGNGAVIGANSVVTKDVPPFAIVAGSPAEIIRYRFEQNKIDELIKLNWWGLDLPNAKIVLERIT